MGKAERRIIRTYIGKGEQKKSPSEIKERNSALRWLFGTLLTGMFIGALVMLIILIKFGVTC